MRLYIILGGGGKLLPSSFATKVNRAGAQSLIKCGQKLINIGQDAVWRPIYIGHQKSATIYELTTCWYQATGILAIRLRQGCVDTFESYRDCCIKANRCVAFGIRLRSHTDVCSLQTSPSAPCASSFLQSLDNLASKIVRLLTLQQSHISSFLKSPRRKQNK